MTNGEKLEKFDFDPSKVKKVSIDEVQTNGYNPKLKDTKEYKQVVKSLQINGLASPIFVRTDDDGQLIIVDGEQRYTAAKELGYKDIYVYDLGNISEERAKALTIWLEVQVPFDEIQLAPIAIELNQIDLELPFTEVEINNFREMVDFDFEDAYKDNEPLDSNETFKNLTVRMTADQFKVVHDAITTVSKNENVSEGRALELLVADGLAGYEQTNYIPETDEETL